MPTVKQIDSYIEERVIRTINNRPLYQLVAKINSITDAESIYDLGVLLAELDELITVQGIGYVSDNSDWEVYSTTSGNITLSYDKETGYLTILNTYNEVINNSINFYYVKDEGTMRASLEQAQTDYHPVMDVYVNGSTVLDENRIAQIKSYKEVTQAEYDALPESKNYDGVLYCIKTPEHSEQGGVVVDVKLDGSSVVDAYGVANLDGLASQLDLAMKQNLLVAGANITLVPLEDGTVRISATGGGGGGEGSITEVTVNGESVVSGSTAAITVPTQTSQLTNNSGYITNSTNSLTNYYTKSAADNKMDEKIAAIPGATSAAAGLMTPAMVNKLDTVVIDVRVDGSTVVSNGIAYISLVGKQNVLTAGDGIDITNDVISAEPMVGATSSSSGVSGAVPAPTISDKDKFLRGDGNWGTTDLSNLEDVNISLPQDGQPLVYNNNSNNWVNMDLVHIGTTASWNAQPALIGLAGHIYVYTDHDAITSTPIPGIKIGDGITYLIDAAFVDSNASTVASHIADTAIHITAQERINWNAKIRCYLSALDSENLVFTTN